MTTIAWDGKTLATDSLGTQGDTVVGRAYKKIFTNVGPFKAVAFAGVFQDFEPLREWMESGGDNPKLYGEFNLICISKKGRCQVLHDSDSLFFVEEKGVWSTGTGRDIALGAMDAGATAIEAVKIACKRDVHTGGKIQSYRFEK